METGPVLIQTPFRVNTELGVDTFGPTFFRLLLFVLMYLDICPTEKPDVTFLHVPVNNGLILKLQSI